MTKHVSASNRGTAQNLAFIFAVIAILAAGLVVVLNVAIPSKTTAIEEPRPTKVTATADPQGGVRLPLVQLDGTWAAEENGARFLATVKNNTIAIKFSANGTEMLYWYGTFKKVEEAGATLESYKIEVEQIVMSRADRKDFVIKQDVLWFEFKAMGMTKRVGLTRG